MHKDGYVECSHCHCLFEQGTIGRDFVGFARKTHHPQGRWHSASEIKTIRFAMTTPLCYNCGGEKEKREYKVKVHANAVNAWKQVDKTSELAKYMPKYIKA